MTRIEDMSEAERQSWITLLADGAVLIYFCRAMTTGSIWVPDHYEPAALGEIFIGLVIVTIILHAGIASVFALRKRQEPYETDERDIAIARRGSRNGYGVLQFGLGIIIISILVGYAAGDGFEGMIKLQTPVQIIFYLTALSYIADLVKQGSMIIDYRR